MLAVCPERQNLSNSFPHVQKVCLQSVAEKQDVFGNFTNWFWPEFDLPVTSLGTGDKEGFAEGGTLVGDQTAADILEFVAHFLENRNYWARYYFAFRQPQ